MGMEYISINLIASFSNGNKVPHEIFLGKLLSNKINYKYSKSKSRWQAATITLFNLEVNTYSLENEPSEKFYEEIKKNFKDSSIWLNSINNNIFEDFYTSKLNVKMYISSWIHADQFDLEIPSYFIKSCANKNLSLSIITND